jgi:hypothetical protein
MFSHWNQVVHVHIEQGRQLANYGKATFALTGFDATQERRCDAGALGRGAQRQSAMLPPHTNWIFAGEQLLNDSVGHKFGIARPMVGKSGFLIFDHVAQYIEFSNVLLQTISDGLRHRIREIVCIEPCHGCGKLALNGRYLC